MLSQYRDQKISTISFSFVFNIAYLNLSGKEQPFHTAVIEKKQPLRYMTSSKKPELLSR